METGATPVLLLVARRRGQWREFLCMVSAKKVPGRRCPFSDVANEPLALQMSARWSPLAPNLNPSFL
jgi:hypothetical protein